MQLLDMKPIDDFEFLHPAYYSNFDCSEERHLALAALTNEYRKLKATNWLEMIGHPIWRSRRGMGGNTLNPIFNPLQDYEIENERTVNLHIMGRGWIKVITDKSPMRRFRRPTVADFRECPAKG